MSGVGVGLSGVGVGLSGVGVGLSGVGVGSSGAGVGSDGVGSTGVGSTGSGVGSSGAGVGSDGSESKSLESLNSNPLPSDVYAAVSSSAAYTAAVPDNIIPDAIVIHKNLVRYLFFIYLDCSLLILSLSFPPFYKDRLADSNFYKTLTFFYSSIIIFQIQPL